MAERLDRILAHCLEEIDAGRLTMEACLERYPAHREELERLLTAALALRQAPYVEPSPAFRSSTRRRLLARLPARPHAVRRPARSRWQGLLPRARRRPALAWVALALLAIILLTGTGVAYASSSALPGDALYPLKTGLEDLRVKLTPQGPAALELRLSLAERRLSEAQALSATGRYEEMESALTAFGDQVAEAESMLQMLAQDDPQAQALAEGMSTRLDRADQVLSSLAARVPDAARGAIERAQASSRHGQDVAEAARRNPSPGGHAKPTRTPKPDKDRRPGQGNRPDRPSEEGPARGPHTPAQDKDKDKKK